jgi:hypothetical protein
MQYTCSVCNQKVAGDMMIYRDHTDKHIVELVKTDHPDWAEKDGMCKKCLEYYKKELDGSIFKDAACAKRIRATKSVFSWVTGLFGKKE